MDPKFNVKLEHGYWKGKTISVMSTVQLKLCLSLNPDQADLIRELIALRTTPATQVIAKPQKRENKAADNGFNRWTWNRRTGLKGKKTKKKWQKQWKKKS